MVLHSRHPSCPTTRHFEDGAAWITSHGGASSARRRRRRLKGGGMRRELASALLCACVTLPVSAADGVSASFGQGARNNVLDAYRVGMQWDWQRQWLGSLPIHVSGYWDLSAVMFENDAAAPPGDDSEE